MYRLVGGSIGGSERAEHFHLRGYFVHEAVQAGHLALRKIDTKLNHSDLLINYSISAPARQEQKGDKSSGERSTRLMQHF